MHVYTHACTCLHTCRYTTRQAAFPLESAQLDAEQSDEFRRFRHMCADTLLDTVSRLHYLICLRTQAWGLDGSATRVAAPMSASMSARTHAQVQMRACYVHAFTHATTTHLCSTHVDARQASVLDTSACIAQIYQALESAVVAKAPWQARTGRTDGRADSLTDGRTGGHKDGPLW